MHLAPLMKYVVANLGETLVLELGPSILCVCEPLPPKLCDAAQYYYATLFMVFSVTNYLILQNTTIFY